MIRTGCSPTWASPRSSPKTWRRRSSTSPGPIAAARRCSTGRRARPRPWRSWGCRPTLDRPSAGPNVVWGNAVVESPGSELEVRGLDVWYGRVQVLFGLDLDVAPGEAVALLGTNGAGKTTLLRAVSGLVVPAAGSVRLAGADLTRVAAEERARRGVVQVRGGDVFPGLSVDENLRAALVAHRELRHDAERRIARVYDAFPALAAHRRQDAASLSGGEQQMVALGCALLFEPRLLLVDELSLGLAPLVVQRLVRVLGELRAAGQAMLVVEQSLTVAAELAARVVFLEKGTVRFDGAIGELTARDDFARAIFLGGPA